MFATEMVIVVTVVPATPTKGLRYKGLSEYGCQVVANNYELDGNANAWNAAHACCVQANLEAREGECWGPVGSVLPMPGKPGAYIIRATRSLYR